ncbi:MAG: SGNH/GDSL hydrolase family protein [Clostridia bacterium]|nr:SGNH/GDSL hydrolase family protein [Clostridia bacterium]
MFNKYASNVSCGTGNNFILEFNEKRTIVARTFFKPEVTGKYNYRFFYQNSVNTTFAQGEIAYVNKSGGNWVINYARVGIGSEFGCHDAPGQTVTVTFNGSVSKAVAPDEAFWTDEVEIDVPEGKYLVWEWEITGDGLPCTPDSQIPAYIDFGEGFVKYNSCPMPNLIGCDKKIRKRIAFIGDSITQGCGTTFDEYDMWVGRIGNMLKDEYSVWNLGLGFSRGSDAEAMGSLMYKAKQNDVVVLTYGVNDLLSGKYGVGRGDTAGELLSRIETIVKELQGVGIEVILSTIPPFHYHESALREWRCVNMAIPALAKIYGCRVYDFEASLDASDKPLGNDYTRYGDHPNGEGGAAACEAFKKTFFDGKDWTL